MAIILQGGLQIHGKCDHKNGLVKRKKPTKEAAWCGTWYDCPSCGFSRLIPSLELEVELERQRQASKI